MLFPSWLRSPKPSARKRPTVRPRLEALDERCLPSTLTVMNNLDGGPGSLRAEIVAAKKDDTIVFAPGLDGQTITLTGGELDINTSLTIQGPGAAELTISGDHLSRVFEVNLNKTVALSGLTISNGDGVFAAGASHYGDGVGGGIFNRGTLTVTDCTISGNTATQAGGGIVNALHGTLTVSDSTISGNSAANGGGIYNATAATVSNCILSGNSAGVAGGGIYNGGTLAIDGSTLSDNSAVDGGGAVNAGTLTVLDSIFSGNSPDNIFGPYADGGGNSFS